jgi:SOS-response transcriptional repressor LexA
MYEKFIMNDDMASRLRTLRKARFSSAKEAARTLNIAYTTYIGHERTGQIPRDNLVRYAKFYRVTVDWLLYGKKVTDIPAVHRIRMPLKHVSLFRLNQLGIFKQIRDKAYTDLVAEEFIAVDEDTPERVFGVPLTDKSMVQSVVPSLDCGNVAFIDPEVEPSPGDMVLAVVKDSKEALVRKLGRTIDQGITKIVLIPFNNAFETIMFVQDKDNFIVGRVRSALIHF